MRLTPEVGTDRELQQLDFCVFGFPLFSFGILLSGNVYEWSTLKLVLGSSSVRAPPVSHIYSGRKQYIPDTKYTPMSRNTMTVWTRVCLECWSWNVPYISGSGSIVYGRSLLVFLCILEIHVTQRTPITLRQQQPETRLPAGPGQGLWYSINNNITTVHAHSTYQVVCLSLANYSISDDWLSANHPPREGRNHRSFNDTISPRLWRTYHGHQR